jgi:hypothetical protein
VLGNNDWEVYTSSDLYLQEGSFFSGSQWVAVDGGFEGDDRFVCSYKNPGNNENRIDFNNVFHEVRTLKENSYQRVGIWFPLLGNNKRKLPYKEETLVAAIQAAVRLHNFIMITEHLSYSAADSAEMPFSNFLKNLSDLVSFHNFY